MVSSGSIYQVHQANTGNCLAFFSGSSCLVIQVLQTVYFPPGKRKSNTLKKDTTTLLFSLIWFGKMSTVKRLLKTYRQLVDDSGKCTEE